MIILITGVLLVLIGIWAMLTQKKYHSHYYWFFYRGYRNSPDYGCRGICTRKNSSNIG